MNCKYCDDAIEQERSALGYEWCMKSTCVDLGLREKNNIVLVCGHKSIYQPMFVSDVAEQATHPKYR